MRILKHGFFILSFFWLFLLYTPSAKANVSIEILSVSIRMNGYVAILYELLDDDGRIDTIRVRYIEEIGQPSDIIHSIDTSQNPILLPSNVFSFPVDTQGLSFLLEAYAGEIPEGLSDIHTSVFLQGITSVSDECDLALEVQWMNYPVYPPNFEFPKPLQFVRVDVMVFDYDTIINQCMSPGQPLNTYAAIMWDQAEKVNFGGRPPGKYCFRIRAHNDNEVVATSNTIKALDVDNFQVPLSADIISVNILDNEDAEVSLIADNFGFGEFEYTLFRSNSITNDFVSVDDKLHSSEQIAFLDNRLPDLDANPWYYYIKAALKDCPDLFFVDSDTISSIFLTAEIVNATDAVFDVRVGWEHDPAWDEYFLKRQFSGGAWENVQGFNYSATEFSYTDAVEVEANGITVYYLLEAEKEKEGVAYAIQSNMVTVALESEVVYVNPISVPHNALRPGSDFAENKVFLPEEFDDPPSSYTMSVFDRNGLLIFSTDDHQEAWDGTINGPGGQDAPAGAYIYQIKMTDFAGDHHEKKGVVYLVR